MIKKLIQRYYNQAVEDVCTRILYFFNTIDTYFLVAGIASIMIYNATCHEGDYAFINAVATAVVAWAIFKVSDFYPLFLAFAPIYLLFLFKSPYLSLHAAFSLLIINLALFASIQFLFMSIPESIVARDPSIGIRKIWNSIFTIAPTTVSLPISVSFSTVYSLIVLAKPNPSDSNGFFFWLSIISAALVTHRFKPRSFVSVDFRPEIKGRICDRVIVLNIDGCRLDRFYEAGLPFLTSLQKTGSYFPEGLQTVYRALTNPAFASILTGALPETHGITSNNLGQVIKVEALPDLVKTKLYGSMHVKHFSKRSWDTKIISLPRHSVYKCDDIMFDLLKEDISEDDETSLFISDISEADFLGHAYGSESAQYLEALKRADKRIARFFEWLKERELVDKVAVIICSDHGMVKIDHSYLLYAAERYVPFIITGRGIKQDNPLKFKASIMDIAPTISYLLGIRYPANCSGRVFVEALK